MNAPSTVLAEGDAALPLLAERLLAGEAAIFPTDTVPALACRPDRAEQLWRIKQRPQDKPLILMGACAADLWPWLAEPHQVAWQQLADQHWPGALTLVLPARGTAAEALHPGGDSLGVRVPACGLARQLLQLTGPLATTSANRSGEPPCLSAEEAESRFPAVSRLAPRPWPAASGLASTVVRWGPDGRWQLLRQGAVMPAGLGGITPG